MIFNEPEPNAELTSQEVVHVLIIECHHRYEDMDELRNDNSMMFELFRNTIPVYPTLRSDGFALSYMVIKKNRKVLNIDFSTILPCTEFMPILRSLAAYKSKCNEDYSILFSRPVF